MSSKRTRVLPPWLQGVTVKSNKNLKMEQAEDGVHGKLVERQEYASSSKEHFVANEDLFSDSKVLHENFQEKFSKWYCKEFVFQGSIIYSYNVDDCNLICEELISSLDMSCDNFIGFDTEWPLIYSSGKQQKTALVQICFCTEKCYLFHISCMSKFPLMLKKLLEMTCVQIIGLNVNNDFWKLGMDADLNVKNIIQCSTIELKTLANKKLCSDENWSLEGLARNVLRIKIDKNPLIRRCDWTQYPLPDIQQRYAATDAVVSLMLYRKLQEL